MRDDSSGPPKEGAGRIAALVIAFLLLPPTLYLLAVAGYTGGRMQVTFMLLSPIIALLWWGGGVAVGIVQIASAFIARGSARFVVRRLALFTLILVVAGSIGSCVGGYVWGQKVRANEWAEPRL